jgi:hypothetical protein
MEVGVVAIVSAMLIVRSVLGLWPFAGGASLLRELLGCCLR